MNIKKAFHLGKYSSHWKGGRSIDVNGYVLLRVGHGHHLAHVTGYAYEHRFVAEEKIGRRLLPSEKVHHKNGKRADNRPENLAVYASEHEHRVNHRRPDCTHRLPHEPNRLIKCCCGCSHKLLRFDARGRPRFFLTGHNRRASARAKLEIEAWLKKRKQDLPV